MQIELHVPGRPVKRYDLSMFFEHIEAMKDFKKRQEARYRQADYLVEKFQRNAERAHPGAVIYKIFQSKMNNENL